jgi:putative endonuclease
MKANLRKKQKAYRFGHYAESFAVLLLRLKGYGVVERRFKTKAGEVDIIACKKNLVVFVEVKARKDKNAVELVSNRQQQRICASASLFIAKHPKIAHYVMRFDVVVIYPWQWPRHITSAWNYKI